MDEKMTNREAQKLHDDLSRVGNLAGVKINYAISKTIRTLKPIIESLEDAGKPAESFMEYEKKRIELMEKFCDLDPKGNPLKAVVGKIVEYSITQKLGAFQKALEKLNRQHKEALEQRENQLKEMDSLLDKPVDDIIKLHYITLEDVPESITRDDFKRIEILIQDE